MIAGAKELKVLKCFKIFKGYTFFTICNFLRPSAKSWGILVGTKDNFTVYHVGYPFYQSKPSQKYEISIYIKLKVCLSVCLSAIEIKLETFRYKQTYESYITFSREAKYGILISIRIVYGGATSLYLFNLY